MSRKYFWWLCALLFCVLRVAGQGPDLKFEHFIDDKGLSQNSVMKILQDNDGYLWIGTPNGLYKYDGKRFTIYRNEDEKANSLIHNSVYELELDTDGNILIGTGRGLCKFDRLTETFTTFPEILKSARISAIYPEKDGSLWVGTLHSGLYHYKNTDETDWQIDRYFHQPHVDSSINSNQIHSITKDRAGNLWVGTVAGLNKLSFDDNAGFIQIKALQKSVKSLFIDKKGKLWVGIEDLQLIEIEKPEDFVSEEQTSFKKHTFLENTIDTPEYGGLIAITQADDNNLWLGMHGYGLYWFDTTTGDYTLYSPNSMQHESLSNANVETIFVDRTNVLWVGTEEGGLNRSDLGRKDIVFLKKNMLSKNSLSNSSVNAIVKSDTKSFWIGTEDGLNQVQFDEDGFKNPSFKHYYYNKRESDSHPELCIKQPVWSILKDSDTDYWIGGTNGITHMTIDKKTQKANFHQSGFREMIEVFSSLEDRNGNLWFGSFTKGLIKWKKKKKPGSNDFDFSNAIHYEPIPDEDGSISGREISCIYEDSKGNLWIGTLQGGLNLVVPGKNGQGDTFISYQHDSGDSNSLSHNSVFSIHEDQKGNYWIGTFGGGLNKMIISDSPNKETIFKRYREKDGLANDAVYGILESNDGNLWVSTDNGISRFDPEKETFKNLNKEDGLQSNNFRKNAYFKNEDGSLFFGGLRGLNIFNPKNLKENTIAAEPRITCFKIKNELIAVGESYNGRVLLEQSLSSYADKKIALTHDENVLTFEFSALHFAAPEKNQFVYKLEGFDEDWLNAKKNSFAHYTNLSPGTYTFKVKASNNDGIWSEQPASLKIYIAPPFWRTIWAYLLYSLLLIGVFLAIRSYFHLKAKERTSVRVQNEVAKANALKLQFFTNISHDFKTPITLIMNPLEEVLEDLSINASIRQKLKIIQRNADYMLRLVNQLMEFRKIEVGETKLATTQSNLVNFVREITFSFNALAQKKHIDLFFESQLYASDVWFDWDKLEKILNNILSNAIKFTEVEGSIAVRVYIPKNKPTISIKGGDMRCEYICIEIEDNGAGIPEDQLPHIFERFYQVNKTKNASSKSGSGIGLAITKDLVDLHYGRIKVDSKVNAGTKFVIKLPLGNAHLLPEEMIDYSEAKKVVAIDEPQVAVAKIEPVKKLNSKNKKTVLVVDDNEDIRALVKSSLEKKYTILEAENGRQALDIVLKEIPKLIVSDVLMPEMDGIEFCHQIKSNTRTKHIPIILLTALNSVEHRIQGIESGADAYIPKPFKMKLLATRADKLIESREVMRQRFQTEEQLTPKDVILDSVDKKFLDAVMELIEKHMSDESYWIDQLVNDMNTSRSTFFRRLKKLTGQPPNDFIRMVRLKRAAQLLEQGQLTIAEVSYRVGFNDPNYFGKCFRKLFGVAPSRYKANENVEEAKKVS